MTPNNAHTFLNTGAQGLGSNLKHENIYYEYMRNHELWMCVSCSEKRHIVYCFGHNYYCCEVLRFTLAIESEVFQLIACVSTVHCTLYMAFVNEPIHTVIRKLKFNGTRKIYDKTYYCRPDSIWCKCIVFWLWGWPVSQQQRYLTMSRLHCTLRIYICMNANTEQMQKAFDALFEISYRLSYTMWKLPF